MTNQLKLGIALPMTGRSLSAGDLLSELAEEVRAAEKYKLDLVVVPEHHTGPPQTLSDAMTTVTWLLASTSRIRIGTGVLLLPLHSEVQIAEQASILQQASSGRFVLGVGTGYQREDFEKFGVDFLRRGAIFEERLQALRRLLNNTGERDEIRPQLGLNSAPPLWVGAWSQVGLKRAATLADGWIADPVRTITEIADMASDYKKELATANSSGEIVIMREGWVGSTDEDARAEYFPFVLPVFRYYMKNNVVKDSAESTDLKTWAEGRALVGSASSVATQLVDLVSATGASTVIMSLRHPAGPDHESVMKCLARLGTEVAPQVEELLTKTGHFGE